MMRGLTNNHWKAQKLILAKTLMPERLWSELLKLLSTFEATFWIVGKKAIVGMKAELMEWTFFGKV